ncbi:hypothetical protein OC844_003239 [Tilletia horrida]|nr:hypothetical protein OC844_003239 [Tilletia horrida]
MDYTSTAAMIGIAQPPPSPSAYPPSQSDTLTSRGRASLSKTEREESRRQERAARANRRNPIHGDNLTPMPMTPRSSLPTSNLKNAEPDDPYTSISRRRLDAETQQQSSPTDASAEKSELGGKVTFANDVLMERERRRIAAAPSKAFIGRRRMWAGLPTLVFLAPSAYCLAKSCTAWLALSPSTVIFSDAREGTTVSPDPMARGLAMLTICVGAVSLAFTLLAIIYLRVSRQRTRLGRAFVWICALAAIILEVAMAVLNILLVFFWHRKYSANPAEPFASTRDAGLRCQGTWEFDIIYTAASYSHLAADTSKTQTCVKGGFGTVRDYMVVGGVRIGIFVALGVWWLITVTRYNRALAAAMPSPFAKEPLPDTANIAESAELHRLLEEEKLDLESRIPGAWDANAQTLRSPYAWNKSYAEFEETVVVVTDADKEAQERGQTWNTHQNQQHYPSAPVGMPVPNVQTVPSGTMPGGSGSLLAPPVPRLSRFDWQRGNASHTEDAEHHEAPQARSMQNVGNEFGHGHRGEGSGSFSGWASSLVASVFGGALGYSSSSNQPAQYPHAPAQTRSGQTQYASVNGGEDHGYDYDGLERQKSVLSTSSAYDPPPITHERGPSKLGVSSWFGGGAARSQQQQQQQSPAQSQPSAYQPPAYTSAALASQPVLRHAQNHHDDSESETDDGQGKGGYASSRTSLSDVKGEGYAEWSRRNFAGLAAMDQQRSSWRSSAAASTPVTHLPNHAHIAHGAVPSGRRYSMESQTAETGGQQVGGVPMGSGAGTGSGSASGRSCGDELPHMPEARPIAPVPRRPSARRGSGGSGRQLPAPPMVPSTSGAGAGAGAGGASTDSNGGSSADAGFWVVDHMRMISSSDATGDLLPPKPDAPTFVRQLGQLVRKLSAIESVGSAGERERERSSSMGSGSGSVSHLHGRGPSSSGAGGVGLGGSGSARKDRRSSTSASGRMGSVEEEREDPQHQHRPAASAQPHGNSLMVPGAQGHHQQQSSSGTPPALPGRWQW